MNNSYRPVKVPIYTKAHFPNQKWYFRMYLTFLQWLSPTGWICDINKAQALSEQTLDLEELRLLGVQKGPLILLEPEERQCELTRQQEADEPMGLEETVHTPDLVPWFGGMSIWTIKTNGDSLAFAAL